jgi:hypothetical protein
VVRQGYTTKKQLQFFNSLVESNKFANVSVLFNGVKTGRKYGYYGYGYSKNNPYFNRDGANKISKKKKESTEVS